MIDRSGAVGEVRHHKIHLILSLLLFISLLVGCVHAPAPYRPGNWANNRIDLKSVADPPDQPLLQVIIVYGPWWDHHSALRLVCPDRPVVFWDPGGSYGTTFPTEVRNKDLISVNPPDLEMYLQHVWNFSSVEVEVFEWHLKQEDANELYDVLVNGTDKKHPAGQFNTMTMGGFCCVALSDFLHRFATKTMNVPRSYFFPYNLARVLYTQSPKRVMAFRRGKQVIFVPPQIPSRNPDSSPSLKQP